MRNDQQAQSATQPDQAGQSDARAQFEAWYVENAFDFVKNPIGSRECSLMWKAWQAAITAVQQVRQQPVEHDCTNCDRKHAEVICPTCAGTAWDNGRLHEFHEIRELSTSLGDGPLDHLLPDEWHEKPLLRFQGAYDEGDSSVGMPGSCGNVLAADQEGTVLGDYLAACATKEGGQ